MRWKVAEVMNKERERKEWKGELESGENGRFSFEYQLKDACNQN